VRVPPALPAGDRALRPRASRARNRWHHACGVLAGRRSGRGRRV